MSTVASLTRGVPENLPVTGSQAAGNGDGFKTFSLQVMSDLHLELGEYHTLPTPPTQAPFLALVGDIGMAKDPDLHLFFERLLREGRWEKIFYVAGNHEFYGGSMEEGLKKLREMEASLNQKFTKSGHLSRFYFLDKDTVYLPEYDVTIIGTTLWSQINPQQVSFIWRSLNDFHRISHFTVEAYNSLHNNHLEYLSKSVEECMTRKIVILTHHAPTYYHTSDPRYEKSSLASAFCSEILHVFAKEKDDPMDGRIHGSVKAWAFGHTHFSCDFVKEGIRVVANQKGYEYERLIWKPDFVINV